MDPEASATVMQALSHRRLPFCASETEAVHRLDSPSPFAGPSVSVDLRGLRAEDSYREWPVWRPASPWLLVALALSIALWAAIGWAIAAAWCG